MPIPGNDPEFQPRLRAARGGCAQTLGEILEAYRGYLLLIAEQELGDDPGPKEDQNERSQELRQRFTQRLARTVRHVASLKRNAGVYIRLLPSTVH